MTETQIIRGGFAESQIMAAVDAYDVARCARHGQSTDSAGMSAVNKQAIAPMIRAAVEAAVQRHVADEKEMLKAMDAVIVRARAAA